MWPQALLSFFDWLFPREESSHPLDTYLVLLPPPTRKVGIAPTTPRARTTVTPIRARRGNQTVLSPIWGEWAPSSSSRSRPLLPLSRARQEVLQLALSTGQTARFLRVIRQQSLKRMTISTRSWRRRGARGTSSVRSTT